MSQRRQPTASPILTALLLLPPLIQATPPTPTPTPAAEPLNSTPTHHVTVWLPSSTPTLAVAQASVLSIDATSGTTLALRIGAASGHLVLQSTALFLTLDDPALTIRSAPPGPPPQTPPPPTTVYGATCVALPPSEASQPAARAAALDCSATRVVLDAPGGASTRPVRATLLPVSVVDGWDRLREAVLLEELQGLNGSGSVPGPGNEAMAATGRSHAVKSASVSIAGWAAAVGGVLVVVVVSGGGGLLGGYALV